MNAWIESHMPSQAYYYFEIRLKPDSGVTESSLQTLI